MLRQRLIIFFIFPPKSPAISFALKRVSIVADHRISGASDSYGGHVFKGSPTTHVSAESPSRKDKG